MMNETLSESPRLAGDLAVWLIILAELLTCGIFFLSYAFARTFDVALFNGSAVFAIPTCRQQPGRVAPQENQERGTPGCR